MNLEFLQREAKYSSLVATRTTERAVLTESFEDHQVAELQHLEARTWWERILLCASIQCRNVQIEAMTRAIDHSNQSSYHFHMKKIKSGNT